MCPSTVAAAMQAASRQIDRRDAEVLLAHTLQRDRAWLWAHPETTVSPDQALAFFEAVGRRAQHWPLQYLTCQQEFFGLMLEVSPDTLIPRPETELLVETVLQWAAATDASGARRTVRRIVDVGTGTGAIALALAQQLAEATVFALDVSPAVVPVFERNRARLQLSERVVFLLSDLLEALQPQIQDGRRFDVIVSNPPYVPLADEPSLAPEVREFEPHLALFAAGDGLAVYRRLVPEAWGALRAGGLLAMEFGYGQKEALAALLSCWNEVRFLEDYAGIPRIVLAERPQNG